MTRAALPSRCPFCPAKILRSRLLIHLEEHEKESYEEEQKAFHKTQAIRGEINKRNRLSTPMLDAKHK